MRNDMRRENGQCGHHWHHKVYLVPIAVIAGIFALSAILMCLWNAVIPSIFGLGIISYWQAMGLMVLSKILFGGFHGHHHGHRRLRKDGFDMREKWMTLSPEEKEKMKKEWWDRFDQPR